MVFILGLRNIRRYVGRVYDGYIGVAGEVTTIEGKNMSQAMNAHRGNQACIMHCNSYYALRPDEATPFPIDRRYVR